MLGTLQCVEQKCIYQLYLCDGEVPRDPLMDIFNSLLGFAVVEVSLGNLPLDLSLLLARVRVVSLPQAGNEAWTAHTLLPHLELKGLLYNMSNMHKSIFCPFLHLLFHLFHPRLGPAAEHWRRIQD